MLYGTVSSAVAAAIVLPGPVVLSITPAGNAGSNNANTTGKFIDMPATVNAGDRLVMILAIDNEFGAGSISSPPSGWTNLVNASDGVSIRGAIYWKDAAGTEGGTAIGLTLSAGQYLSGHTYRIEAGTFDASKPPESTAMPSWGIGNTLWIAAGVTDKNPGISSYPLPNGQTYISTGGSDADACASYSCWEIEFLADNSDAVDTGFSFGASSNRIGPYLLAICPATLPALELTGAFPDAVVTDYYSYTPTAQYGTAPYTYSIASGSLPSWASLDTSTGLVDGVPDAAGSYSFTVRVTDDVANTADLPVSMVATIATLTADNPFFDGLVGVVYGTTISPSHGQPPYAFAVHSGSLPAGLSLDTGTGEVTGTPTTATSYTFTIRVTDDLSSTVDVVVSGLLIEVTPLVLSVTETQTGSDNVNHVVAMPATVDTGDRLVICFANDGSATVVTPIGWAAIDSVANGSSVRSSWFYKDAAGTEGGTTVNLVTSGAEQGAAQVYRIQAGTFDSGTAPEIATATGNGTTQDTPALAPSWGSAATLWLQSCADDNDSELFYAAFGNPLQTISAAGAGSCNTYSSYYQYKIADIVTDFGGAPNAVLSAQNYVSALLAVKPA